MEGFYIHIDGMKDPKKFVDEWSKTYKYSLEYKYENNIDKGFDSSETLMELMRWKNGTRDTISENKTKRVDDFLLKREDLKKLKTNFSLSEFEEFLHPEESSTIWKIFILHIIDPYNHPIFDQHVYRSYKFIKTGEIKELPTDKFKEIYRIYKDEYKPWFNELKVKYTLEPRMMDKSLVTFGSFLKKLNGLPISILNQ
jgi:hypothetical protein